MEARVPPVWRGSDRALLRTCPLGHRMTSAGRSYLYLPVPDEDLPAAVVNFVSVREVFAAPTPGPSPKSWGRGGRDVIQALLPSPSFWGRGRVGAAATNCCIVREETAINENQ